jgi:hypothetical protein
MAIEQIEINKSELLMKHVKPNVIRNRFDLLYGDNFELYLVNGEYIPVHIENRISSRHIGPFHIKWRYAKLGIYIRDITTNNLLELGCFLSKKHKLHYLELIHTYTEIPDVEPAPHWHIELPENIEEFNKTLDSSVRYNIKRFPRKIRENFGSYNIIRYKPEKLPNNIMDKYMEWKRQRFDFYFDKPSMEYLKINGVSDVFVMYIGNKENSEIASIGFVTITGENAFWENFAFNDKYAKYSVGMVLYYHIITELITDKKKIFFLFGSEREYKRHYNGVKTMTYSKEKWKPMGIHALIKLLIGKKA